MNELLLWMSARRSGSHQLFRAKVAELGGTEGRGPAQHRLAEWDLSRLGHAEFEPAADAAGWRIAPPVLAAADYGGPWRGVLCGARFPGLLDALSAAAAPVELQVRVQPSGPDAVEITAPSASALADAALRAGLPLQWNAPLAVLAVCPSPRTETLSPVSLPIGGWTVSRFSKSQLAWVASSAGEASGAKSGFFRFAADQQRTTYILMEGGQPHASDPASGKFRILGRRNRALRFDPRLQEFSVRTSCRPPPLVERALVLCSGLLPEVRSGHVVYSRIDHRTAAAVSTLLGQRLS